MTVKNILLQDFPWKNLEVKEEQLIFIDQGLGEWVGNEGHLFVVLHKLGAGLTILI